MSGKVSENVEEYLEAIYRLKEKGEKATTKRIAGILGISQPSVSEMLKKLRKMGYVEYEPYQGVELKGRGGRIGRRILRRHRLIERFLGTLGISRDKAHDEACRLEHSISKEFEDALKSRMEGERFRRDMVSVTELGTGQGGEIVSVHGGRRAKRRLEDLGLIPGTKIEVVRAAPFGGPVEIRVKGTTIAVGERLAARIYVKVVQR